MAYGIPHCQNTGGKLMAQNLRVGRPGLGMRLFHSDDGSGKIFVQIRATDPGHRRRDQHVIRRKLGRRFGYILNADVPGPMKPNCSQAFPLFLCL